MFPPLAYAQSVDPNDAPNILLILSFAGLIVAACMLGFVPVALALSKRRRQARGVLFAAFIWAILAASTAGYVLLAHFNWNKEQALRLQSGYGDPHDLSDAPAHPLTLYSIVTIGYVALLVWSVAPNRAATPPN